MTAEQLTICGILIATMAMFIWGRWRHDMVAVGALLACVTVGLVRAELAFEGFGHPAVVTVACVLVLSYGLQTTGAVDALAQKILPTEASDIVSIAAISALAAALSGFMNNVGALALLMPVALQMSQRQGLPPGRILMPMSFGSILGGTTTLIGTPPNLIVSGFRAETGLGSYGMFDFSPVGIVITIVGVLFIGLIGWRLVPNRKQADSSSFDTGTYLTEVRIVSGSKAVGKSLREVEVELEKADAQIVGLARGEMRVIAPYSRRILREDDILIIEAEPESLATVLSSVGLKLEEEVSVVQQEKEKEKEKDREKHREKDSDKERDKTADNGEDRPIEEVESPDTHKGVVAAKRSDEASRSQAVESDTGSDAAGEEKKTERDKSEKTVSRDELVIQELVVMPGSFLIGRSATDIELRTRYGINLLAISRQGRRSIKRLRSTAVQAGDVLLMQGVQEAVSGFASDFGCVPLATRDIRVPDKQKTTIAVVVLLGAVGGAALGLVPAAVSFAAGVLAYMALRVIPPRSVYQAVDWTVIVLLAAMLPVAGAMAATGTADVIAAFLLDAVAQGSPVIALAVILVVTMTLSDFMNNAATAAVMCPLAISSAAQLGVNPDSYLMAVAIGASCAFLTPIGHQNNTLILGPGGFRFGDYWRLGLPLEILLVAVSIPVLLWVWPL